MHFEDVAIVATPQISDIFKGRQTNQATTVNLAQLAMSTLGVADRMEEKTSSVKTMSTTNVIDSSKHILKKGSTQTSIEINKVVTTEKCSLQEGVRMMVTPSMFMSSTLPGAHQSTTERAILNPAVNIQKAFSVAQSSGTSGTSGTARVISDARSPVVASGSSETSAIKPPQGLNGTNKANGKYQTMYLLAQSANSFFHRHWKQLERTSNCIANRKNARPSEENC